MVQFSNGLMLSGGNFLYASETLGLVNYGGWSWARSILNSDSLLVEHAWQLPIQNINELYL